MADYPPLVVQAGLDEAARLVQTRRDPGDPGRLGASIGGEPETSSSIAGPGTRDVRLYPGSVCRRLCGCLARHLSRKAGSLPGELSPGTNARTKLRRAL